MADADVEAAAAWGSSSTSSLSSTGSRQRTSSAASSSSATTTKTRTRRRLTVSEAAAALHGLALSGSFDLDAAASATLAAEDRSRDEPPTARADSLSQHTTPAKAAPISMPASSLPPRRQSSSPLALYSTSADVLAVRRASTPALPPQPQHIHAAGHIPATTERLQGLGLVDEDGKEELRDAYAHPIPGRGTHRQHSASARYLSLSPSARRPSGPASTWIIDSTPATLPMPSPSSPLAMPSSPLGWRSTSLGHRFQGPHTSPLGSGAFSPSTASYSAHSPISPFSRHPSFSSTGGSRSASLSLVGSYDESLLSGRMSTMPSQPFDFDAELGVLGLATAQRACPRKLRCPKHLSISFEARYYPLAGSEATHQGTQEAFNLTAPMPSSPSITKMKMLTPTLDKSTVGSPYVGSIDLEAHYLAQLEEIMAAARRHALSSYDQDTPSATSSKTTSERTLSPSEALAEIPPFPGYQVPPKGQIQLIVKNQNLTAVKVFLVKYDLSDMQPGSKTFLRQKSYVCAEVAKATAAAAATPPSTAGRRSASGEKEKETMRYAVHLQFACPPLPGKDAVQASAQLPVQCAVPASRDAPPIPLPSVAGDSLLPPPASHSKGKSHATPKIYLHRHIRVVFAATGLDSFERLDVVTESPGGVVPESSTPSSSSSTRSVHTTTAATGSSTPAREMVYSAYSGPSETWKRARRAARRQLVAMREEEEQEARRRAALEAEAGAEERGHAEADVALLGPAFAIGDERRDEVAMDSSVHSAFGIPAPRTRSRTGSTMRTTRVGLGSDESDDALVLRSPSHSRPISPSLDQAEPVSMGLGMALDEVRAPSPAQRALAAPLLRRRRTLSRGGVVPTVPATVDEHGIVDTPGPPSSEVVGSATHLSNLPGSTMLYPVLRPGTSSSMSASLSSSSALYTTPTPAEREAAAAAAADEELLELWHRSLRRSSVSQSSGHGHPLSGSMGKSSASLMMMMNGARSPPPLSAGSRPTSPTPQGSTLGSVREHEAVGQEGRGPTSSSSTSLLAQLEAQHRMQQAQLLSLTTAGGRSGGVKMRSRPGSRDVKTSVGAISSSSPPRWHEVDASSSSTSATMSMSMPRLIRRVSGSGTGTAQLSVAQHAASSSGGMSGRDEEGYEYGPAGEDGAGIRSGRRSRTASSVGMAR